MAIRFFSGKPGAGKSLLGMHELELLLLNDSRPIGVSANMCVNRDALQWYMMEAHPKWQGNVLERIHVISDEDYPSFFRFRSEDVILPPVADPEKRPDFFGPARDDSRTAGGTVYFLDEIHLFFNARKWQATGESALWYLSQHRKLGDDVYCITQSIGNVDKQFRSLAQEFIYVRNKSVEKYRIFKGRNHFETRTFLQPVTSGNEVPCEIRHFTLDVKGLASCYDTAGGTGVRGAGKGSSKRAKGLPLWTIPVGIAVAAALVYWVAGHGVGHFLNKVLPASHARPVASVEPHSFAFTPKSLGLDLEGEKAKPPVNPVFRHPELTVAGYVVAGGKVNVLLSDGTVLTEQDRELQTVRRNEVVIDGRKYALRSQNLALRTPEPASIVPKSPAVVDSPAPVSPPAPADDGIARIPPLPPLDFTPRFLPSLLEGGAQRSDGPRNGPR